MQEVIQFFMSRIKKVFMESILEHNTSESEEIVLMHAQYSGAYIELN